MKGFKHQPRFCGRYSTDIPVSEMVRLAEQELECINAGGFDRNPDCGAEQQGLIILLKICHDIDVHKKLGRPYQPISILNESDHLYLN